MKTTYSDHQYDSLYPPGIEYHWWTRARNRLLAKILRRECGDNVAFLEVGCGKGLVVKSLKDCGFNIHGVELADVVPVNGAQQLIDTGTDVFEWAIEHKSEITGLLLLDVIEHLPEPEPFLKKLTESFPNLFVIVITVPACQELWSEHDAFCGHYRRYSLEMLEKLSMDINWRTKAAGYFFRLPYLPMRLMSLFEMHRNSKLDPPGKLMRQLHRLVSAACQLEQAIMPPRVRGSSAYSVFYRVSATQQ
jgi:hypothetical protein